MDWKLQTEKRRYWKFRKIHKKAPVSESFFKVANVARNFIKKETLAQVFSCEFYEVSKNTYFIEHRRTTAPEMKKLKHIRSWKIIKNLRFVSCFYK